MALRTIVKIGDDILRKKCRLVTKFDDKLCTLIDDMRETLVAADGAGLAAPQVGMLRRVVVIDVKDKHGVIELVNPEITAKSGSQKAEEGCLSAPDEWYYVERPSKVTVKAQDRFGKEFTITGEDMLARALCHEIDHLDGILFIDRKDPDQTAPMRRKRRK